MNNKIPNWIRITMCLYHIKNKTYGTKISKVMGTTTHSTYASLQTLKELGIIETIKEGQKKFIQLTNEGIEFAKSLNGLKIT